VIHRVLELGQQGLERLLRQRPWQGSAPAQDMTGVDRGRTDEVLVVEEVENMVQRLPSPIAGRRGSSLLRLGLDNALDCPTGAPVQRCSAACKEHLEIQGITRERVRGVMAPRPIGTKRLDRTGKGWHRSPRKDRLAYFHPRHGRIIWLACGGLIKLRVAQCHPDGPMAHERFHHLPRGPGVEPLRRQGTAAVSAVSRAWRALPL
jgi:hypothetical protein